MRHRPIRRQISDARRRGQLTGYDVYLRMKASDELSDEYGDDWDKLSDQERWRLRDKRVKELAD